MVTTKTRRVAAPAKVAKSPPRAKAPATEDTQPKPAARAGLPNPVAAAEAAAHTKAKNKLVRDSFTIPKVEYTVLQGLKLRAANLKRPTKKSELLRAGIGALQAMNDRAFLAALSAVPSLKTGRPKVKSMPSGAATATATATAKHIAE
jgi:hypothetical protein